VVSWRDLGGPARAIGTAIDRSVTAAQHRDRDGYLAAAEELAALPAEQAGLVLGALARMLLEESHPDGLDADDIQAVLDRCLRDAAAWLPVDRVQPRTVVAVLAGALGIHEPGLTYAPPPQLTGGNPAGDDWPGVDWDAPARDAAPTAAEYARHAPLVVADLLAAARRPLRPYLDAAFTEIARAESMDG
jgi:hypothetical protein